MRPGQLAVTGGPALPFQTEVTAKFVALTAPGRELAACRASDIVDLAGVRRSVGAQPHAAPIRAGRERIEPEVSRLDLRSDVVSTQASPQDEILGWNQDAAVMPRTTAGAACETIGSLAFAHVRPFPLVSVASTSSVW